MDTLREQLTKIEAEIAAIKPPEVNPVMAIPAILPHVKVLLPKVRLFLWSVVEKVEGPQQLSSEPETEDSDDANSDQ